MKKKSSFILENSIAQLKQIKKALVVGGAGFLGYSIVQALRKNNVSVSILSLAPEREIDPAIPFFEKDIRNYEAILPAFEGVDTVFHVTSLVNPYGLMRRFIKELVYDVNVKGTHNVIKACLKSGVSRLIYTSSDNVVFDREIINGDETLPYVTRPIDIYSKTKALAEKAVLAANGQSGLLTCALRPSGIYGPGDKMIFPRFLKALKKGQLKFSIGKRETLANRVYIDNIVQAHLLAASHLSEGAPVCGQPYFIHDGEASNYFSFFNPITEKMGFSPPRFFLPCAPCYALAYLFEFFYWLFPRSSPLLSRAEMRNVSVTHTFSIEKAKKELGYTPSISQQEGIERSLPYCRALLDQIKTVKRPQCGWWVAIVSGLALLSALSFSPSLYAFFSQSFTAFFTPIQLKALLAGAIFIHLSEAFFALKIAKKKRLKKSAGGWFLQTLLLGYPSLRLLLKEKVSE